MGRINWGRVLLCGMVAGLAWWLLSAALLVFLAGDLLNAVPRLSGTRSGLLAFSVLVNLGMGIWAMWLYAAIRPRYGPGPGTAAIAGVGWWAIYCLSKANWGPFGLVDTKVLATLLAASLPALVLVTVLGAWPYEE